MACYTDEDEERLPEHFKRIGYDSDTQIYTFEDTSTGRLYESGPGNRYGVLNPVGETQPRDSAEIEAHNVQIRKGNKEAVRLMLPFALLVIVCLLLLFKFLYGGGGEGAPIVKCGPDAVAVQIKAGDTCWKLATAHRMSVEGLLALQGNAGVDCERLRIGQGICVPA